MINNVLHIYASNLFFYLVFDFHLCMLTQLDQCPSSAHELSTAIVHT